MTGVVANMSYDSRGRATETSITPPGGTKTSLSKRSYDELDRMKTVETAPGSGLGITASFTYDAAGRLMTLTGPRSTTTTLTYDAVGRVAGVVSPTDIRSRTVYDDLGRLLGMLAPAQGEEPTRAISLTTYDPLSRPKTTTTFAEDGTTFAVRTLTYDIASRVTAEALTGATSASASTDYDDLDRVKLRSESGPAGDTSFAYTYDAASLPLTHRITGFAESATTTMTYAKTNELATIGSAGRNWYVAYAGSGRLSSIWSNLSIHTRSFDIYGRLEAVRTGFKLADAAYQTDLAESALSYDTRGRTSAQKVLSSYVASNESFSYDAADRLSAWTRTGLGSGSANYGYDPSGNVTTATISGATMTFSYDLENRLTGSVAGSSVTSFTNDLYGRRTSKVTGSAATTYTWDPASHLAALASPDATATYAYGISGMREEKTVTTASGTTTTKSVWSGGQLAVELDSDGTRYTYLWGPGRIPLSVTAKTATGVSTTYAYHTDALGSVIAMTEAGGGVVATYAYDPWGRVTSTTGTGIAARNPLRYRSYYLDAETDLYYMPARYYDPATYRFLSADPAAPSAGDPGTLNAFAYCQEDPVDAIDPSGARADWDGDGKVGVEDNKISNERDKANSDSNSDSDYDDVQKAATSTIFGVLDWTAKHRKAYMTEAMWTMYRNYLEEYGSGGPEHYSWTEYSQKSKDLIRAKLLGAVDSGTAARWARGRQNHGGFHDWRSDIPLERRFERACVSGIGGTSAWERP
ncbi:MAG: hypothetical protein LLG08_11095 [Actinomycetia bacterium]|nr:hypothetical protein [Actinomycetes bacterium]